MISNASRRNTGVVVAAALVVIGSVAPAGGAAPLPDCDFNGDGFGDLAVGVTGEDLDAPPPGAVHVVYGSLDGLTAAGNQLWYRGAPGLPSTSEEYDSFGSVLTCGDFNGDLRDDLAIGAPYDSPGGKIRAGSVRVLYGGSAGLTADGSQRFHRAIPGMNGGASWFDEFGRSVVAGDFNGDGYDDLAVGVHKDVVDKADNAGSVHIIYGTALGLSVDHDQIWHRNRAGINGRARTSDDFGHAIAAADFDGDGIDDLAVGVPRDDFSAIADGGSVHVIYGTTARLSSAGDQVWHRAKPDINKMPGQGDKFGRIVWPGDFDGDGYADLAIGVPFDDFGGMVNAGTVHVIYGSSTGLTAEDDQVWHRDRAGIDGVHRASDGFPSSLASGDFDADLFDDLAIGVPLDNVDGKKNAGSIHVIRGSDEGLTASGDQVWHQGTAGVVTTVERGDKYGGPVLSVDFDGDGTADLAIGVRQEKSETGVKSSGEVDVLYGATSGLTAEGNQAWWQGLPGMVDDAEQGDLFGWLGGNRPLY